MDLLVNDLSLHGQFPDLESFRGSISRVMKIRTISRQNGWAVSCHRSFVNGQVTKETRIPEALKVLRLEEQRAVMSWLSRQGPFWDDARLHDSDDWYEWDGNVVTDSAVGEAAHCLLHGIDCGLVSLVPSNFSFDPVEVDRVFDDETRKRVDIPNHWEPAAFKVFFAAAPPALTSWTVLADHAASRCTRLTFAGNAFEPLRGHPFQPGVAKQILVLLDVLQRLRQSFDEDGARTAAGQVLYEQHFTGGRAWFSDSSNSEKNIFKNDLTFPHPENPERNLFCPWHGKVNSPKYRIHFSWPVTATTPTYVVYVGPKITKQ